MRIDPGRFAGSGQGIASVPGRQDPQGGVNGANKPGLRPEKAGNPVSGESEYG